MTETGARWQATYEFQPMTCIEAAAWLAFLTDLLGAAGHKTSVLIGQSETDTGLGQS